MCKTYSYFSAFIADNQGFEGSDRDSGPSRGPRRAAAGTLSREMVTGATSTAICARKIAPQDRSASRAINMTIVRRAFIAS